VQRKKIEIGACNFSYHKTCAMERATEIFFEGRTEFFACAEQLRRDAARAHSTSVLQKMRKPALFHNEKRA